MNTEYPAETAQGNSQHTTLGDEYPKEQARVREIYAIYRSLGPTGAFGAMWIGELLTRADKAAMEQDLLAMIGIYQEMKDVEL